MLPADIIAEAHNDIYCKLAPSPIHGVGVFAIKDIPPNTIIFRHSTEFIKIDCKFLRRVDEEVSDLYKSMLRHNDDYIYIPVKGFNSINMSFYVNHHHLPTARYDIENSFIVSKSKIKKGEEITINYKVFDGELPY